MNKHKLRSLFDRMLLGETVKVGVFQVWEDFLYTRRKDAEGKPQFKRVISMVYFDEEESDDPATEDFDGTIESFARCLNCHDALSYDDFPDADESEIPGAGEL